MSYQRIVGALRRAVEVSKSPGAVLYVGDGNETFLHEAHGFRQRIPRRLPARKDTVYDLASLTKVIATATAVLMLRDEGLLSLEDPVSRFVPLGGFAERTIFQLLTHTSGLTPGNEFYEDVSSLDELLERYAEKGANGPPAVEHRYSDAGYMLLGKVVELTSAEPFDVFCRKHILEPLGMTETVFNPGEELRRRCAATEKCPWRGRMLVGEVHDEKAYAVGGVAGHAGLFSTASDLARFCRGLLAGKVIGEESLAEMTAMNQVPFYPWQGLGWQIDPWASKKIGFLPRRSVFGHTGWTGTSMWLDPERDFFAILLSNTCHPSRKDRDNERLRRIVHRAISEEFYGEKTNTHSGLDRVVRENFHIVKDRRMALLTHHAAVDQQSRHILEVLALTDAGRLKILFSPEHGLRGQAEAGEFVASKGGRVPVVSLYGKRRAPTAAELRDLDLFVVDLQDVGSRYYTYMATMRRCMEACAQARVPVVVLDRPNPLGGEILEGPIAVDTGHDVCSAAIPIRHGMTLGELATYFLETSLKGSGLRLSVNTLDSWESFRPFGECSLPWVAPSPNIPTAETALLYAGMCLFEGTNLNEGRGTDSPFAQIGAPWLDADRVIAGVRKRDRAGLSLAAVEYVPRSIPGKSSHPRYENEVCAGIAIGVDDFRAARPVTLALALVQAIRGAHPEEFAWGRSFDVLAGGPDLRLRLEADEEAWKILASHEADLEAFDEGRPKLYTDRDALP